MMDDAVCEVGTAVLQYVEKCLVSIFNKCENVMSAIQAATDTAKETTEVAYRAVENIMVQKENEEALRKESKSCGWTYVCSSSQR